MSNAQALSQEDLDQLAGGGVFNVLGSIAGGVVGLAGDIATFPLYFAENGGRLKNKEKILPEEGLIRATGKWLGGLGQKLDDKF